MKNPLVSVILPVYNAEKYLNDSIKSIINQTYKNFELIIIEDGSTDKSLEIINKFKDNRIKIISHKSNTGLIYSLNEGIKISNGELIARMDADDISLETRFEKQVDFLNLNKDIGICSTWYRVISNSKMVKREETNPLKVKCKLLFGCPIAHPAVMMKKEILSNEKIVYSHEFLHAEDYELWIRLSHITHISNYPEVLLLYRFSPEQVSQKHKDIQRNSIMKAQQKLFYELGINPSFNEIQLQNRLFFQEFVYDYDFAKDCEMWLLKLKDVNKRKKMFNETALDEILFRMWYMLCSHLAGNGVKTKMLFMKSELFMKKFFTYNLAIKFNVKSILHHGF